MFESELTAEENVRLYGAVMGMTKKEMEEKRDLCEAGFRYRGGD